MLRESRAGLLGELSVETTTKMASGQNGHITWGLFNLAAVETRTRMAERLAEITHVGARDEWFGRLEYACYTTANLFRRGSAVVRVKDVAEVESVPYIIEHILPAGQTSIIFGKGGGGKGWLSSAISVAVATGNEFCYGLIPTLKANVLYLDWESTQEEARRRFGWLARGAGITEIPDGIYYRNMTRPLEDEAKSVRADISRHNIGLVIVDSLVPACSDDPTGADPARQVMDAMRSFSPATRLVIAHMTKAAARADSGEASVFGSVFFENLGRSVWELRCSDASQASMDLALFHRKVNLGAKQPPAGWRLLWSDTCRTAKLVPIEVGDSPDLAAHASLAWRIRSALRRGKMTTSDLAEECQSQKATVRAECNRMRDVVNVNGAEKRGLEATWGLIAKQEGA
ncbi:MAG: AAA family ATPase [Pseudomonadota bacterium]